MLWSQVEFKTLRFHSVAFLRKYTYILLIQKHSYHCITHRSQSTTFVCNTRKWQQSYV